MDNLLWFRRSVFNSIREESSLGRVVNILLERFNLWRLVKFPISLGRSISWLWERSSSLSWRRLPNEAGMKLILFA